MRSETWVSTSVAIRILAESINLSRENQTSPRNSEYLKNNRDIFTKERAFNTEFD